MASTGQDPAIAKVYAASILEVAEAQERADAVFLELVELAKLVADTPDLSSFFYGPSSAVAARAQTIEKLFRGRLDDLLVNALQVMDRKGRLGILPSLVEAYRLALEDLRGIIDVHVRSAVPLFDPTRDELRAWTLKRMGKTAELHETIDASLLGGMVVQVGDEKFDCSVATYLSGLLERLMERASQQIHAGAVHVEVAR